MAKTTKKRRGPHPTAKVELDVPVRVGQTVEVEITGLNHEGAGAAELKDIRCSWMAHLQESGFMRVSIM